MEYPDGELVCPDLRRGCIRHFSVVELEGPQAKTKLIHLILHLLKAAGKVLSHLILTWVAISLFPEHFEAKEANLPGQDEVSGGVC